MQIMYNLIILYNINMVSNLLPYGYFHPSPSEGHGKNVAI